MKNSIERLLETDHESLAQLLAELDAELAKPNTVRAFELLDLFWARLAVHIRAEHLHLFPAIANAPASLFTTRGDLPTSEEAQDLLLQLRSDHDVFMKELAQLMKIARQAGAEDGETSTAGGEIRERLGRIKECLETHNRLEESLAYVWPALLFDEPTVAALSDRLQGELQHAPPRFA